MTCHSDAPVWPVPRTYEDLHKEFLPKDRDGAVIFIKHKLYHRLMSAKKLKKAEARFLHDLLDIIERS